MSVSVRQSTFPCGSSRPGLQPSSQCEADPAKVAMLVTVMVRLVMHLDTSYSLTEMTVQYLLELEWTARTVLSHLNRRVAL